MTVSISQTANPAGAGTGTTITYATQDIGVADVNRIVVVAVGAELSSGSPSSATIDYGSGAVAMSAGTLGSQGNVSARIFYLPVPTGTTADIAITFGASQGATTHHIAVYRVVGGKFSVESAVGDTDADPISSGAITIPTGGGCIAIAAMAADATARTWAGITEDIDADAGTFQFTTGTSTTAGTPTITVSGGNNEDGALAWLILAPGYALAIDAGSYAVTGQTVSLEHKYFIVPDAGSYAVTGQDVTLSLGHFVTVDAGSYAITGQDVSLDLVAAINRAVVSWAEISFGVGVTTLSISVDSGSYAITGQDVTLTQLRQVIAESGIYLVSGQDVTLTHGFSVAVDAGSYAISGQTVALTKTWLLNVDAGSYAVTGQDVTLTQLRQVIAESGIYLVSGQDVELTKAGDQPAPVVADAGGAGDIHPIRSRTDRRRPQYRRFRALTEDDVTAAEIRDAAQDLRAEAKQAPLSEAVEDDAAALAQIVQTLGRIDRLSSAVADLSRAVDFAVRLKAEAEQREQDDDEATMLLLH